jgi:hypothetical protein
VKSQPNVLVQHLAQLKGAATAERYLQAGFLLNSGKVEACGFGGSEFGTEAKFRLV